MSKKAFVLDTNVLLRDFNCIYSFDDNDVYIPFIVICELDNLKNGNSTVSFFAREASRNIASLLTKGDISEGVQIQDGSGKLFVQFFENKSATNDDVIIEYTKSLMAKNNMEYSHIVLVSKDINVRIKAASQRVKSSDYTHDLITNIKPVGDYKVIVSEEIINELHKNGEYTINKRHYQGQYLLLISKANKKNGCIVKYKDGKYIKLKEHGDVFNITPTNAEQKMLVDAVLDREKDIIFVTGCAGVGKTLLSLACGLQLIDDKKYQKIMLVKSIMPTGGRQEEIGFLPGTTQDKLQPYFNNFDDNLELIAGVNYTQFYTQKVIERAPIAFMRGRSLNNAFIFIDECQNLELSTIKTLISRVGQNSKIVLAGDPFQIDNPFLTTHDNGLVLAKEKLSGEPTVAVVNMFKNNRSNISKLAEKL